MNHTPEPWTPRIKTTCVSDYTPTTNVVDRNGAIICTFTAGRPVELRIKDKDNAERIVACVNVLEGIDTEMIILANKRFPSNRAGRLRHLAGLVRVQADRLPAGE